MAVRIRLTRVGMTKQPTYRFVVMDSRSARDGRSLETLGHYNPRTEPVEISVDADKAKEWMSKGAKPSDTVDRLFRQAGVLPKIERQPTAPARGPRKPDKLSKAAKRGGAPAPPPPAPKSEAPAAEAPAEEPVTEEATAAAEEPAAEEPAAEEPAEEPTAEAEPAADEPEAEAPAAVESTEPVAEASAETAESEGKA